MNEMLNRYFKISERGSTVSTEIIGGATTFATMAYILIVMPGAMSTAGINPSGVLICTAFTTAIACIFMGLYANMPICMAPVLVIPNIAAQMIADGTASFEQTFGIFFLTGIVFLLISLLKLREMFARCLPKNIKIGISAAVGFLIVRIGLGSAGFLTDSLIGFSDLTTKPMILSIIGLLLAITFTYTKFKINGREYRIRGSLLISIVLTTIIGLFMGVVQFPASVFTGADFSAVGEVAFKIDILGALNLKYVPFFLLFLINDFFGTMGSSLALAGKAGLLDEDGNFPAIGRVFLVDASATVLGSLFGITTISTFAESAAGIESGSRTGLSAIVTALFFLLCMFFAPLFIMIPGAATGSALIIIGVSLVETLSNVDFTPADFVPVAVMIIVTIFAFDFVGGIAIGMFAYLFIQILRAVLGGEKDQLPTLPVVILAALMVLYFIF